MSVGCLRSEEIFAKSIGERAKAARFEIVQSSVRWKVVMWRPEVLKSWSGVAGS